MKKIYLFTIFLLFTSILSAQLRYGVKGGFNFASFGGSDAKDVKSVTRFQFGGYVNYSLPVLFGFQAEALYSMKGAQQKLRDDAGNNWTASYNIDYLEIPVLIQLNIPLAVPLPLSPYLEVGPSLGVTLSAKEKLETQGFSQERDFKNDVTSTDFGLALGFGFNVLKTFGVNLRYTFGFNTVDNTADPDDIKNSVVALSLNYNF
ncbi:MAG: porin family protein [Ignavibacteria bacterium]